MAEANNARLSMTKVSGRTRRKTRLNDAHDGERQADLSEQ